MRNTQGYAGLHAKVSDKGEVASDDGHGQVGDGVGQLEFANDKEAQSQQGCSRREQDQRCRYYGLFAIAIVEHAIGEGVTHGRQEDEPCVLYSANGKIQGGKE